MTVDYPGYLANESDPVSLVLDLRITHDRLGSSSDPSLNGKLHYPHNTDWSLNVDVDDKIRKYHTDYRNNPPNTVSFIPTIPSTSGRLHCEFVRLLFLQDHRETDRFFSTSGVHLVQHDRDQFHFRHTVFTQQLKIRIGLVLVKETVLRITLNLDGTPIISKSHTHPSHSQTSRLVTSSLSLGVSVPRSTQCM
jgi:hypothetical protein